MMFYRHQFVPLPLIALFPTYFLATHHIHFDVLLHPCVREKALKSFKSSLTEGGEFDAMMQVCNVVLNVTSADATSSGDCVLLRTPHCL